MDNVSLSPTRGDALVIIDMQYDFLPGGTLAVPEGDSIIPVLNRYIKIFDDLNLPVVATRDWHPGDHCSFQNYGGIWPVHCVAGTKGAEISIEIDMPERTLIVSKATTPEKEAYSGLDGTNLGSLLSDMEVKRVWVGGLATDYCVLATVKDFLAKKFEVILLMDAIRAVNVKHGDDVRAEQKMINEGAQPITSKDIE